MAVNYENYLDEAYQKAITIINTRTPKAIMESATGERAAGAYIDMVHLLVDKMTLSRHVVEITLRGNLDWASAKEIKKREAEEKAILKKDIRKKIRSENRTEEKAEKLEEKKVKLAALMAKKNG